MTRLNPYVILGVSIAAITAVLSLLVSVYYLGLINERNDWEKAALDQAIKQEKHNARIVDDFHQNLAALGNFYKLNPVGVRVISCPKDQSTGAIALDAKNIILTVGGANGSHGGAILK